MLNTQNKNELFFDETIKFDISKFTISFDDTDEIAVWPK